jgi:TonB family protein
MIASLALFAAMVGEPQDATAPLEPTGKWEVEQGADMCTATRPYGDGSDAVSLTLRAFPLWETLLIFVGVPTTRFAPTRLSQAAIGFDDEPPRSVEALTYTTADKRTLVQRLRLYQKDAGLLAQANLIHIEPDGRRLSLHLTSVPGVVKALATCDAALLKGWGIDPDEKAHTARGAEVAGDPAAQWITTKDYPAGALKQGRVGTTTMIWAVGLDGRVHDCRIIESSGTSDLDAAACHALEERGRYTPAIGTDGKPMVSHITRVVRWGGVTSR